MICSVCKEDYTDQRFIDDFKDSVCLPCNSQIEFEKFEKDCADQLERWNKKTGNNYSEEDFFYLCDNEEVTSNELTGFPLLKETLEYTIMIKADQQNVQLELFPVNDLPF